jgi:hypothetical protein
MHLVFILFRFLWVTTKLDGYCRKKDEKDIWQELECPQKFPPATLNGLYDQQYEEIRNSGDTGRDIAERALKLLFCGRKQLSKTAFLEASFGLEERSFDRTAEKLTEFCCGLALWDERMGVFRFSHPTVRDYLEQEGYEIHGHNTIAEECLKHLLDHPEPREPIEPERGRSSSRESSGSSRSDRSRRSSRSNRSLHRSQSRDRFEDENKAGGVRYIRENRHAPGPDVGRPTKTTMFKKPIMVANQLVQSFYDYATIYWTVHCSLSSNLGDLKVWVDFKENEDAFQAWVANAEILLGQHPWGFFDFRVESQIDHSLCSPFFRVESRIHRSQSRLFFVGCAFGFTEFLNLRNNKKRRTRTAIQRTTLIIPPEMLRKNRRGLTGLQVACKFGQFDVARMLLIHNAGVEDKDENGMTALHYAVENVREGSEKKALDLVNLLIREGGKSQVSTKLLIAAARHPNYAVDLLNSVLPAREGQINWEVLKSAAGNRDRAKELVQLLLKSTGVRVIEKVEKVLIAAVTNPYCSEELLNLLLKLDRGTAVTEEVLVTAAKWSNKQIIYMKKATWNQRKKAWKLLLGHSEGVRVTAKVLEAAMAAEDKELVRYLLSQSEGIITEEVVEAAVASMLCPYELLGVLLSRQGKVPVTEKVLKAALESPTANKALLGALWTQVGGGRVRVTGETLKTIATNQEKGGELLQFLLEHDAQLEISDEVIIDVALGGNTEVLESLLVQLKPALVQENVFRSVVSDLARKEFVETTLETYSKMVAAGQLQEAEIPTMQSDLQDNLMKNVVQLMLNYGGMVTGDIIKEAASVQGKRVMKLLLKASRGPIEITEAIVVAAARNRVYGHNVLAALSQETSISRFTEAAAITAAASGSLETLAFLLDLSDPPAQVKKAVFINATRNYDAKVQQFVFRRYTDLPMTEDEEHQILLQAAKNSDNVFQFILEQSRTIPMHEDLVEAVAENCARVETMDMLLTRTASSYWKVKQVMIAAAKNRHDVNIINYLLDKNQVEGGDIDIDKEMLCAAACNPVVAAETLRVLFNRCEDRKLKNLIDSDILEIAASNGSEAPEALKVLLLEVSSSKLVTWRVILGAINNKAAAPEAVQVLLEVDGVRPQISHRTFREAAGKTKWNTELMEVLKKGKYTPP